METTDDRALELVLDGRSDDVDADLRDAAGRASRDVERIRRGLHLAADLGVATATPRSRRRRPNRLVGVAAVALLVVGAAVAAVRSGNEDTPSTEAAEQEIPLTPPTAASGLPRQGLAEQVDQADAVVIGTVSDVTRGELAVDGGLPYVLATIEVSEWIKSSGTEGPTVVAFDYTFAGPTSAPTGDDWVVGEKMLLFLVSDAGTVSESLEPAHLQVAGGHGGRFPFEGDQLSAPFSLDELRRAAGSD